jgi:hypothetical protein
MSNVDDTLKARGSQYNLNGSYADHAQLTQDLKERCREHKGWVGMPGAMKESLDMILHKIARIINGNPNYKDNWLDIMGYARLIERELDDD